MLALHGVPIAVKDLCFTAGVRTMGGTRVLANHVPNFVRRVEAQGGLYHLVLHVRLPPCANGAPASLRIA